MSNDGNLALRLLREHFIAPHTHNCNHTMQLLSSLGGHSQMDAAI